MKPFLSIIIPAYNESGRIGGTLSAVHNFLSTKGYIYEIIVVNDGSNDSTTEIVRKASEHIPEIRLLALQENEGKGAAVKAGMLAAKGDVRLFMDADNSTSIEHVEELLPYLQDGYDVAIGSRRIEGAIILVTQSPIREALGACFRFIAHFLIPLDIKDTQNGFKLFSRNSSELLFKDLRTKGWGFDVEILSRAQKLGLRIKEVPIVWMNDGRSKMRFSHMIRIITDLCLIKFTA